MKLTEKQRSKFYDKISKEYENFSNQILALSKEKIIESIPMITFMTELYEYLNITWDEQLTEDFVIHFVDQKNILNKVAEEFSDDSVFDWDEILEQMIIEKRLYLGLSPFKNKRTGEYTFVKNPKITQEMFNEKVYKEYQEFRRKTLKNPSDDIFEMALEINFKTELMRYLSDPENTPYEIMIELYQRRNILNECFLKLEKIFQCDFTTFDEVLMEILLGL